MNALPHRTLLSLALLIGCAAPEEPAPQQDVRMPEPTTAPESMAAEVGAEDERPPAFADPNRICNALAAEGLAPSSSSGWSYRQGMGYGCIAQLEVTPWGYTYVGDVPNMINLYAQSDVRERVERFQLNASIYNEQRGLPVVSRFKELTRTLFARLDLEMPEGLLAAIERGQSETFYTDYGTVTLTREAYNMGHGLSVDVEAASASP